MDSCAAAHLTTVVLRRLVLRMVHCVGGLNLVSDALRSRVFDLLRRDSKHSKRKSRADFRLLPVGFTHTHLDRCCTAPGVVSVLCSKLEDNGPIKCVRADEATIFAWCGQCVPDPVRGAALG